jgi:hypothetical protein
MTLVLLKLGSIASLKNNSTCAGEVVRVAFSAGIELINMAWA